MKYMFGVFRFFFQLVRWEGHAMMYGISDDDDGDRQVDDKRKKLFTWNYLRMVAGMRKICVFWQKFPILNISPHIFFG